MATKDVLLKKRLIRQGIVALVLLVLLGGAGYFLSGYDDDSQAEKQSREGENGALRSEKEGIRQELGTGFEVSAYYNNYIKTHNARLTLDRETVSQLLNTLREENHLASLTVTISPVTDATLDAAHLKSGVLTKSEVHLTFGAVSDNSIYGFIEALESTLPGIVAMKDLRFTRSGEVSGAVITSLSQHRITPLVTGEITFLWLGLRAPDPVKGDSSPAGSLRR